MFLIAPGSFIGSKMDRKLAWLVSATTCVLTTTKLLARFLVDRAPGLKYIIRAPTNIKNATDLDDGQETVVPVASGDFFIFRFCDFLVLRVLSGAGCSAILNERAEAGCVDVVWKY